ncbi:MAG TPA: signal recognition particle subunit SRP19/SEC65 family protein [Candidatus Bathyarchaeia archaeon]
MRKQDKAIIWPAYFDCAKTRNRGRRVPKSLAIPSPKIEELQTVARRLGLENEIVEQVSYPKVPWQKTGSILIEKKTSKEQIIRNLAKQLGKIRSESQPQQ